MRITIIASVIYINIAQTPIGSVSENLTKQDFGDGF